MREKSITISENVLFDLEQVSIDAILASNHPNINKIVEKHPDCYHIRYPNEFDIDKYRKMVSNVTNIELKYIQYLSFDQLQMILNTYENDQNILLPFTDENLDTMYQTYIDTKYTETVCNDPTMQENLTTEIVNCLVKLRELNIKVDCKDVIDMKYTVFETFVNNSFLKNKTYNLNDVMNPMLLTKIKEMEKYGQDIDINILKTMTVYDIKTYALAKKNNIKINEDFF